MVLKMMVVVVQMVHNGADDESNTLPTDGVECNGAGWCRWCRRCRMMQMVSPTHSLQTLYRWILHGSAYSA